MSTYVNFRGNTLTHLAMPSFPMTSEEKLGQKCQAGFNMLVLISLFCMASDKCIAFTDFQYCIIY